MPYVCLESIRRRTRRTKMLLRGGKKKIAWRRQMQSKAPAPCVWLMARPSASAGVEPQTRLIGRAADTWCINPGYRISGMSVNLERERRGELSRLKWEINKLLTLEWDKKGFSRRRKRVLKGYCLLCLFPACFPSQEEPPPHAETAAGRHTKADKWGTHNECLRVCSVSGILQHNHLT